MGCCGKRRRNKRMNKEGKPEIVADEGENNSSAPASSQGQKEVKRKSKSCWKRFSKWRKLRNKGQQDNSQKFTIVAVEGENNSSAPASSQGQKEVKIKSKSCWKRFSKWRKSRNNGQQDKSQKLTIDAVEGEKNYSAAASSQGQKEVESNTMEKQKEHLQDLTCSICQHITVGPHRCHPCGHIFCAWCLQEMRRRCFERIECALCRRPIQQETFCRDLDDEARASFPDEYFARYCEVIQSTNDLGGGFRSTLLRWLAYWWYVLKLWVFGYFDPHPLVEDPVGVLTCSGPTRQRKQE